METPKELITDGYKILDSIVENGKPTTGIILPMAGNEPGNGPVRGRLQILINDLADMDVAQDAIRREPEATATGRYRIACSIYVASSDERYDAGIRTLSVIPSVLAVFDEAEVVINWE